MIENDFLKVIASLINSKNGSSLNNQNIISNKINTQIVSSPTILSDINLEKNQIQNSFKEYSNLSDNHDKLVTSRIFNSCYEIMQIVEQQSSKISKSTEKFSKNALAPFNLYFESMNAIYDECLSEYQSIISKITIAKKSLDKLKSNYFESITKMEDVKRILEIKDKNFSSKFYLYQQNKKHSSHKGSQNNQEDENDEDSENEITQDLYIKLNTQVQILSEHLKYEIYNYNEICDDCEKKYYGIFEKIRTNDQSRISFQQTQETKFAKLFISIGEMFLEFGKELEVKSTLSLDKMKSSISKKSNEDNQIETNSDEKEKNNSEIEDSFVSKFKLIQFDKENLNSINQQAKILVSQMIKNEEFINNEEELINEQSFDSKNKYDINKDNNLNIKKNNNTDFNNNNNLEIESDENLKNKNKYLSFNVPRDKQKNLNYNTNFKLSQGKKNSSSHDNSNNNNSFINTNTFLNNEKINKFDLKLNRNKNFVRNSFPKQR